MITLLLLFIWIVVAGGLHGHRIWYYRHHPLAYSRRGEGLVSFSGRQWWWIMSLWPLSIIALILYAVLIVVAALIERIIEFNRK